MCDAVAGIGGCWALVCVYVKKYVQVISPASYSTFSTAFILRKGKHDYNVDAQGSCRCLNGEGRRGVDKFENCATGRHTFFNWSVDVPVSQRVKIPLPT